MNEIESNFFLKVNDPEEDDQSLVNLTTHLMGELNQFKPKIVTRESKEGEMGGAIVWGSILLMLISSGTVAALINVIAAWLKLNKKKTVQLIVREKTTDGQTIEITKEISEKMKPEKITKLINKFQGILDRKKVKNKN